MKIFFLIPLFSLVISQQCMAGQNCPLNQGICTGETCQCLEGYKTVLDKALPLEKQTYCNYQQVNHYVPLVLEFCPAIGLGHFYAGKYIQGLIKLFLGITWLSAMIYLHKEFQIPDFVQTCIKTMTNKILGEELKNTGDGFTKVEIAQNLFLFTFYPFWILYIADIYMYITKSYKDGNGIPLV